MENEMESMEISKNMYFLTEAQMHMENGRGIMSFIVTFGEKRKSKYMGDENDIFLTFQKVTFNQNWTFWMQLHVRHFM